MDVFVFPDYRPSNPYQTLVYDGLGGHVRLRYTTIAEALLIRAASPGAGPAVFHLHWEDAVYRQAPDETTAWREAHDFVRMIDAFTACGGHLLWTVHNEAPHDGLYPEVHAWLVPELNGRAAVVHVHSQAAARHLASTRGLDPARIMVTPHGNYLDYHAPWPGTQTEARRRHGLPEEGRILLLFGRLGAYKGAQDLLAALHHPDLAGLSLVIAGRQIDPVDTGESDRVIVRDRFLADDEVPALFAAADAVVAPYRRTLTSGTAVLALSLGRPVIAPGLFHIAETVEDGRTGFLYDPEDSSGLATQLRRFAASKDLETLQAAARAAGARLSWDDTTQAMLEFYRSVWIPPEQRAAGLTWLRPPPPAEPPETEIAMETELPAEADEPTEAATGIGPA